MHGLPASKVGYLKLIKQQISRLSKDISLLQYSMLLQVYRFEVVHRYRTNVALKFFFAECTVTVVKSATE